MAAVILLQALSASFWYMSWAGWVPLLQTRWVSSYSRVMRLSWPEQVQLGLLAGVAPLRVEEPLGQVEEQRRGSRVLQVLEAQVHGLTDDTGVPCDRGPDQMASTPAWSRR